jgi:hypothetical protein
MGGEGKGVGVKTPMVVLICDPHSQTGESTWSCGCSLNH